MTRSEFLKRKKNIRKAIEAKNTLSDMAIRKHSQDMLDFEFDLQLFGKDSGKMVGKVLLSIAGFALGFCNPAIFGVAAGANGVSWTAGLMGAALGGTLWTALSSSNTGDFNDKDTPSIQRFDRAQESMSSTGAIPVVYGTRKIAGNQTFHETNAEANILHKHVVLCEGGIGGILSVTANELLIPTNGQSANTVFTITNVQYQDARVWKDGKTLHLYCNGHDRAIYLCNKDDAKDEDKIDSYYEWQTNISSLISYINRLHEGWQAFPYATTTKYPGDLKVGGFGSTNMVSQGITTCSQEDVNNWFSSNPNSYRKWLQSKGIWQPILGVKTAILQEGDRIETDNAPAYFIIRKVNYPSVAPVTVEKWGRTYTYTPKVDPHTTPLSYEFETFGPSAGGQNCYNGVINVTSDTVTGGTSYTFHDCEPPSNFEQVGGYPNMAWLDMTFNASSELSGGNPAVECVIRGKKVYDPRTGRTEYSENPALIVGDFLCNKRYGLGRWISADDLDMDSFVESADYCDEMVTVYDVDNNPIKSKRYTLNMVIDQRQDAIKWLQDMLANFAGWLVISKNKIKLLVERPTPICYKFNDDNTKDMKIVPLKASDTPNQYEISICDPQTNWKVISLVSNDFADQKARGKIIPKRVELSGVTSQSQALRLARYYNDYNLSCPITLSFKTGIEAMALECGDVVTVTYRDAFENMPIRISTIKETAENEFEISGRQYNPSIYSDDLGGGVQTPNYGKTRGLDEDSDYFFIANVEQLRAETLARRNLDGNTAYDISVTYKLPANYHINTARVYYKTNATSTDSNQLVFADGVPADELGFVSDWKFAGENVSQVIIPNCRVGDVYKIRVVSKTRKGKLGDIDASPEVLCKVQAKTTVPAKPYNLRYDFSKEFRFMWEDVPDSDVIYYEIRTDANVGATEGLLGRTTAPTIAVHLTKRQGIVYVFAINAQKKASEPATVEYVYPKPDAPINLEFYPTPRGMRIIVPPFPESVFSMNLYITGTKVSEKISSDNSAYVYMGEPDIYSLRVAYVDLIGEGYMSQEYEFVIEPTFPEEWIKDGSLSIEKFDEEITKAVERVQKIDSDITKLEEKDGEILSTVSKIKKDTDGQIGGIASQISQQSDKITSIITELNQTDPSKCSYSAIAQLLDGINLRVKKGDLVNQINMTATGTRIDGKYLHVTGTTKFDKDVITEGMIKAGSITAEKMASQMITLQSRNGLKGFTGGQVRLDSTGMTVKKNDGSAVLFNGSGMSFRNKNGGIFSALGAFMVGVAHDGQYIRFNKRWDRIPTVFVSPVRLQSTVAGFTNANLYQVVEATEVTQNGFRMNCRTVMGAGSNGSVPLNIHLLQGNISADINEGGHEGERWNTDPWGNGKWGNRLQELPLWGTGYLFKDNKYYHYRTYTITPPPEATRAEITLSAHIGGSGCGIWGIHMQVSNNLGQYTIRDTEACQQKVGTTGSSVRSLPITAGTGENSNSGTIVVEFPRNGRILIEAAVYCYCYSYGIGVMGVTIPSPNFDYSFVIESIKYNTSSDTVVATGDAQFMVLDECNKLYSIM